MIQTSQAWKDYAQNNFIYHIKAVLTSADGTVLNLTDEDFMMDSVVIHDSISDVNTFTVGAVITNQFSCTLNNTTMKFDDFNFDGATIAIQLGIIYADETEEWINRGVYTVEQPYSLGSTIQLDAYDLMDKMNSYYMGKTITSRDVDDTDLFDPTTVSTGRYLTDNNVIASSGSLYYSDYISVTDGTTYVVGNAYGNILLYDSNNIFLESVPLMNISGLGLVFTASSESGTVSYIRKNGYVDYLDDDFVKEVLGSYTDISFPITSKNMVKALADYCGVPLNANYWELTGGQYTINEFEYDETTTCRQILAWIMQVNGIYGRMDENGELVCKVFNADVWGDDFSNIQERFSPWGYNILDHIQIQNSSAINTSGQVISYGSTYTTLFINASNNDLFYCSGTQAIPPSQFAQVAIYDSSRNFVIAVTPTYNQSYGCYSFVVTATNAAYIRLTFPYTAQGSSFLTKNTPVVKGCFVDGGTLTNWANPFIADGGTFMSGVCYTPQTVMQSNVSVYDVAITGVYAYAKTDSTDPEYSFVGSDGYTLSVSDNALIRTGATRGVAQNIYNQVRYLKFRLFDATIIGTPSLEAGDTCIVEDYRGRNYSSLITSLSYKLNGTMEIRADAETPERNSIEMASTETQVLSGAVTTAVSMAKNYTDTEVQEAKDYSDSNLQEAKDYTDGKLATQVYVNNGNLGLRKIGNIVELRLYGITYTDWNAFNFPSGYRPSHSLSCPSVIVYSGKVFQSYIQIYTDGSVGAQYYDYSSGGQTPAGAATIWGTYTYFVD